MPQACTWREGCDGVPAYPLYTVDGTTAIGIFCSAHAQQAVRELGRVLLLPSPGVACACDALAE